MLDPFTQALPTFLGIAATKSVRILREPNLGRIIPDLLIGSASLRSEHVRPRSTHIEAHLLAVLDSCAFATPDQLSRSLYLERNTLDRIIQKLVRLQIVAATGGGAWRLARIYRTEAFELIAVEAKLYRWREALDQAVEYLSFANKAFVVLDGNRVTDTVEMRRTFREAGIGLLFQTAFTLRVSVNARRTRPTSPERIHALDKLYGPSTELERQSGKLLA